jgi:hypothetical protein
MVDVGDKMDRLTVPFQPLNAPLSCALLGRRSWAAPGSGLTGRLHRALVVLGRCPHIVPEATRGGNRGIGSAGVGGGVGGKSCLEVSSGGVHTLCQRPPGDRGVGGAGILW